MQLLHIANENITTETFFSALYIFYSLVKKSNNKQDVLFKAQKSNQVSIFEYPLIIYLFHTYQEK